jgi:hypothetical protein
MTEQFFRIRKGLTVANATSSANLEPNVLTVGTSTVNATTVNASSLTIGANFIANTILVTAPALNITNQVNTTTFFAATTANVGSNVQITTSALLLGNTSVNLIANSIILKLANSTVNTSLSVPSVAQWSGTFFLHANGSWAAVPGTAPAGANTQVQFNDSLTWGSSAGFVFDKNTNNATIANTLISAIVNATSVVNSAAHTVGTAVVANSVGVTTTGFVNAATVVNSASYTIAATFIANTLGVYHTGTMNATSLTTSGVTVNTSGVWGAAGTTVNASIHTATATFTANSTLVNAAAINITGQVNTVTFFASTSANLSGSAVFANSTGLWTTGTVNAATIQSTATFTANSTLVNTAAINVTGRVNTATLFATTTANVGSVQINTTALIIGAGIVNATNFNATSNNALNLGGVAAASFLQAGLADQAITGGARITVNDLGNLTGATITPDPGDRPMQKITNNGAGTIAPGSNFGNYLLDVINTTGAGAITTSGWTKVSGDSFDTTTTSKFRCHCSVTTDASLLSVVKIA